jgi:uncharacterized protein
MDTYVASIEQWRKYREDALKAPDGWLSVAGLIWLDEGENTVDGIVFVRRGSAVWLGEKQLKPDEPGPPDLISVKDKTYFVIVRGEKTGLRVRDKKSPFLRDFVGLHWYSVRPEYRIEAKWIPYDPPQQRLLDTVLEGFEEAHFCPGIAEFEVDGATHQLEPMLSGKRLFFIFRDKTSGKTTYGASRFLYAEPAVDGKVILDFNKAYNPPCVFTPFATCPLPPASNWLQVAIEAGELKYEGH